MNSNRRDFLRLAAVTGAGLAAANPSRAIEPIRRDNADKGLIKLSLAAYSFHRYMNLKAKTKPTMNMDDFVDFAAGIGLTAVEPTSYYFADTGPEALARFRGKCTRLGLDVSGTAVGNDFCKADPTELRKQIQYVKDWVDHAALIGAKTIRIFAGALPKGDSEEKARARCVEAIQESCDYAGKFGIYLALENHGGIVATAEQMLAVVTAVKHDWFGVNFDTGNFQTPDPYVDLAKIAPYAVVVQIKTEIQPRGQPKQEADLKRLLDILRGAKFRGYVALEYEAAEDPKTAVPKAIEALRKLI
jgi:sugar phosphate isomerase/epimerase